MKRIPIILAMIFFAFAAFASFDWKTVKTEEFEVFYKPGYEKRALKLLSSLDYFKNIPEKITGSKKTGIPVLLEDFGISAPRGGCANPVYYVMSITNDPGKEAFRMPLVGAHEYTHMLHLTRSEGLPSLFTFLFGGAFAPPLISPGWAIEGITTYTESKISKYSSRLNNGAYDSYIGACVAENEFPSVMKATYRPVEMPSYLSWYLFGGEFFDFFSKKYGEEKFAEFFEKYSWWPLSYFSPVLPVLGIDSVLGNVYGKPAEGLWEEWEEYERERFKDFKMQGQKITGHGWYSRYPVINSGFLYYNRVVVRKHAPFSTRAYSDIVRINTKNMKRKKIMSTTSSFTHPVVFAGGNVYYSIAETKGNYANTANYGFGSFAAVYEENPETGKKRKICEGRIRTFYADGNALYYAADKKDGFGSKIYSVGLDGLNKKHLFDTDYLILRFSNDGGVTVVEARKEGGNADLYFFDPENKSFREMVISPYSESNPAVCGKKVFFDANYGFRKRAYAYDTQTGEVFRLTSNGYAEHPAYDAETGKIYYTGLNTAGYDIYSKKAGFEKFELKKQKHEDIEIPILKSNEYKKAGYAGALPSLLPKVRIPLVYFDEGISRAGVFLNSQDATGEIMYAATLWYDPENERIDWGADLSTMHFTPLILTLGHSSYDAEDVLYASADYMLLRRSRAGISNITAGLDYNAFRNYERRELVPRINILFEFPKVSMGIYAAAMLEGPALGSIHGGREGVNAAFSFLNYHPNARIGIKGEYMWDPDNENPEPPPVRGYANDMEAGEWTRIYAEVSRPVAKIRSGVWWLPLVPYIEDLTGGIFFDSAYSADETRYTYGMEVHAEVKAMFEIYMDIGLWAGVNRDSDFSFGIMLRSPLAVYLNQKAGARRHKGKPYL